MTFSACLCYDTIMSSHDTTLRQRGGRNTYIEIRPPSLAQSLGNRGKKTDRTRAALFHNGQTATGKNAAVFRQSKVELTEVDL